MHFANSNSLLGNAKGAHDVFVNTLPKIEMIVHHEWYWDCVRCEYADVVFGVDSWLERQLPDVYGSVSNPFLQAWCSTPMERIFDTLDDMEVNALVAGALGAARRSSVRRLLAFRHRTESRRLHPACVQRRQRNALPVRRSPRVVQAGHALLHDVPHVAEDRRLGADQRERAVVHEVRPARVLPRRGRVHRIRREHAAAPRTRRRHEVRAGCPDGHPPPPDRARPARAVRPRHRRYERRGPPGPPRRAHPRRDRRVAPSALGDGYSHGVGHPQVPPCVPWGHRPIPTC